MNYLTFVLINGPLLVLNITTNAFYTFCMVCPHQGEKIKQPLKLLLGTMICSSTSYVVSILGVFLFELREEFNNVRPIPLLMSIFILSTSMNSSVWLNFFYYVQIVPAQRAFFHWIKKNIKPFIYCMWLMEKIYSLLDFTVVVLQIYHFKHFGFNETLTWNDGIAMPDGTVLMWGDFMFLVLIFLVKVHFCFCLCVMMKSSVTTAVYLCRHMQRMIANGYPLSCPCFSRQVRVTITGVLQGTLYMFCSAWLMYIFLRRKICPFVHFSVISWYMSGTMLCLGAGQTVFRQRAADIWTRAAQWYKAPQAEQRA
nr:PREDICTED: uncharacterized protein LOC103363877 [Stegastes partitus]